MKNIKKEMVLKDILKCECKDPFTVFYISKFSTLSTDRIKDLNNYIDLSNYIIASKAMELANKGYSNKKKVDTILLS